MKTIDLNDYVKATVNKKLEKFSYSLSKSYDFEICCRDVGKLIVWTKNQEFSEIDINLNLHGLIKKVVIDLQDSQSALEEYKTFFEQQINTIEKFQKRHKNEEEQ